MCPTPVKMLFVGSYLDGSLEVAQSKIDKTHIMFGFTSLDMSFSGNTTLKENTEITVVEIEKLLEIIATEYYNRCMYLKEAMIKDGFYLH